MGSSIYAWLVQHPITQSVLINSIVGAALLVIGGNWRFIVAFSKERPQKLGEWQRKARVSAAFGSYAVLRRAREDAYFLALWIGRRVAVIFVVLAFIGANADFGILLLRHPTPPIAASYIKSQLVLRWIAENLPSQALLSLVPGFVILFFCSRILKQLSDLAHFDAARHRYAKKIAQLTGKATHLPPPRINIENTSLAVPSTAGSDAKADEQLGGEVDTSTHAKSLHKGVIVTHPKYGKGLVLLCEGFGENEKVTVRFEAHGIKKFVTKFAQLSVY